MRCEISLAFTSSFGASVDDDAANFSEAASNADDKPPCKQQT